MRNRQPVAALPPRDLRESRAARDKPCEGAWYPGYRGDHATRYAAIRNEMAQSVFDEYAVGREGGIWVQRRKRYNPNKPAFGEGHVLEADVRHELNQPHIFSLSVTGRHHFQQLHIVLLEPT